MKTIQEQIQQVCDETLRSERPGSLKPILEKIDHSVMLESAQVYGTPQYLLDIDQLKQRAEYFASTMRQTMPHSDFFYAFKCNDLPVLVKSLKETGFHADVAGLFELKLALELGFEKIIFNSPGKSTEELALAIKERKRVIINIDHMDELNQLKSMVANHKIKGKIPVGFRLNSVIPTGVGQAWSKFGFPLEQLKEVVQQLQQSPHLEWAGLHFHTSWNKKPVKYLENIERIGDYLETHFSPEQLKKLRFLDIGGGFFPEHQTYLHKGEDKGIIMELLGQRSDNKAEIFQQAGYEPYLFSMMPVERLETFATEIGRSIEKHILPYCPDIAIYFEPGRFIATPATTVLLQVIAVKSNCVIVDGGINMLGDYKFAEYSFAPIINISRPSSQFRRQVIYGPLCDPEDLWGYSYMGEELQKGDILAVPHQGAYTFCTAWRFIKAIPPYIAKSGKSFFVAKEKERFKDRYAGCLIG